jgi:hypothetical protein
MKFKSSSGAALIFASALLLPHILVKPTLAGDLTDSCGSTVPQLYASAGLENAHCINDETMGELRGGFLSDFIRSVLNAVQNSVDEPNTVVFNDRREQGQGNQSFSFTNGTSGSVFAGRNNSSVRSSTYTRSYSRR